jgi:hypothetical protein
VLFRLRKGTKKLIAYLRYNSFVINMILLHNSVDLDSSKGLVFNAVYGPITLASVELA